MALYALLADFDRSPIVLLNRAIALSYVAGPEAALVEVDSLSEPLRGYHLFHATRATLLTALGRDYEAANENLLARDLTRNQAEVALIQRRIGPSGSQLRQIS